jgi:hypothetical protein
MLQDLNVLPQILPQPPLAEILLHAELTVGMIRNLPGV